MRSAPLDAETVVNLHMMRAERLRQSARTAINARVRERCLELARAYERRAREVAQREFDLLNPRIHSHLHR